ncbi:uncharacterized protein ARMOST_10116 [Armillaria ostoyae]|uniref:Uncharacterized protein n=1 Tax=Armillaria ostoyae TaxID=47428 RepID=A0A284RDF5_ARMOS|nr:uncharacterized protein ARMOST_10116 [Armillaria ostoyae]
MKIPIELDTLLHFIKKFSDTPTANTMVSQSFLAAVADVIKVQSTETPTTCSKKHKQDPSKTGDTVYNEEMEMETPDKGPKWRKTDCHNAETKDTALPARRINMAGCPDLPKALKTIKIMKDNKKVLSVYRMASFKGKKTSEIQNSTDKRVSEDSQQDIDKAIVILQQWKWPTMGRKPSWATNGTPPTPTLLASRCLTVISTVRQEEHMTKLMSLIDDMYCKELDTTHDMQAKGGLMLMEINKLLDHMQ